MIYLNIAQDQTSNTGLPTKDEIVIMTCKSHLIWQFQESIKSSALNIVF